MITDTWALVPNPAQFPDVPVGWATVVLAVATVFLGFLNWRVIREMKEARKASERPALLLWSVPDYIDDRYHESVTLNVQNGGKGPVEEAKVECWLRSKEGDYVYLLYDNAISFAPGENRKVGCHRRPDNPKPPMEGDLVVRLRWRGARPWWSQWQKSEPRAFPLEEMKRHGTKFESKIYRGLPVKS